MRRVSPDPSLRPIWNGTTGPSAGTPRRAVPSWRRTTTIDIVFPGATGLLLRGTGRDLLTTSAGATVLDEASTTVGVEFATRTVTSCRSTSAAMDGPSAAAALAPLVGVPATGRFRKAVAECIPAQLCAGAVVAQLLDDTPVVVLIGGASLARRAAMPVGGGERRAAMQDICVGWKTGGEMSRAILEGDDPYLGEGPYAPSLEDPNDPLAWPAIDTLHPGSMRRRRRVDVRPSRDGWEIDLLFRDSYAEPDGSETVVHEYAVDGSADADGVVTRMQATAHVLPGPECPLAAASANACLVGTRWDEVRSTVTSELTGITTCTHLNDALRALGMCSGAMAALRPAR